MAVYDRYARPLPKAERDAYWQQAKPFARLFGVVDAALPPDWAGFVDYWGQAVDALQVTPAARRIARDVLRPRLTPPLLGVPHLTRAVTSDLLPAPVGDGYRLPRRRLHRAEASTLQATVRALRPYVPTRYAYWPHYCQAIQRIAAGRPEVAAGPPVKQTSPALDGPPSRSTGCRSSKATAVPQRDPRARQKGLLNA